MVTYGIVDWWLKSKGYSDADFEIENTYKKTKDSSINSIYNKIMTDAQNSAPSSKLSDALKDLAKNNRNFRREHMKDVDTTIDSSLQEAFKSKVRAEVDGQLGIYSKAPAGDRSRVRGDILSSFENVKISNINKEVEDRLFETIRSEIEDPILQEASANITGSPLNKQELFELWHSDRSTWMRIKNAERLILMS